MTVRPRVPIGDLVAELCDRVSINPNEVTEIVITPDRLKMSVHPNLSLTKVRPFWPVTTTTKKDPNVVPVGYKPPATKGLDIACDPPVPSPALSPLDIAAWLARGDREDR